MYFVINNSMGDTTVEGMNKEELLKRVEENYYGKRSFLKEMVENDTNYWREDILIIKGEIVTPEPKTVVKTFDVE